MPDRRPLIVTTPLVKGEDVLAIQKKLVAYGIDPGPTDGEFGVATAQACRVWKYRHGVPLHQCTADAGLRFQAWLVDAHPITLPMKLRAAARRKQAQQIASNPTAKFVATLVALAKSELAKNVKESPPGSNDGVDVRRYQSVTGAFRAPWCASFCCWLLRNAGYKGNLPELPAYCPSWESKGRDGADYWQLVPRTAVRVGDFALYDFGEGVAQHIGLVVVAPDSSGQFEAIEGNTSTSSDDNGGAVLQRVRNLNSVRAVVRVPAQ